MRSKRPHQEDRSQISDCQNFKVSPLATDLISENNEGDLYIPERKMSDFGATLFAGDSGALDRSYSGDGAYHCIIGVYVQRREFFVRHYFKNLQR